jgi:hypothetical protein
MAKRLVPVLLVVAALGWLPTVALADEIVHFTNGAEMTVRSHAVEKEMVKLDLGGNSFIAFPMSMVDKIVSSGRDVFVNPSIHPANQAVAGSGAALAGGAAGNGPVVADTTIQNGGGSVGFVRQPNAKGGAGVMLGEAADAMPVAGRPDPNAIQAVANSRRIYNPAFPAPQGGMPQVIMPPSAPRVPGRLSVINPRPPDPVPTPPVENGTPETPPQGDSESDPPPEAP